MKKLLLAALAVTALAMSSPATAQVPPGYPPRACTVGTSGSLLSPGDNFTVIVNCPGLSGEVTVTVPGIGNLALSSNGQGRYSGSFVVPRNMRAGLLTITANNGGKVIGTTRANVVAPLSGGGKSSGSGPWALVGATGGGLALLIGLGLFLKSRAT